MKTLYLLASILFCSTLSAQSYENVASEKYPYGRPHPDSPKEMADFEVRTTSRRGPWQGGATARKLWQFDIVQVIDETLSVSPDMPDKDMVIANREQNSVRIASTRLKDELIDVVLGIRRLWGQSEQERILLSSL